MLLAELPRKDQIINTAIDLLDEAGTAGLTTKAIARRQNITEAAIYKYFHSKKEIIEAVLVRATAFDKSIQERIIQQNMGGKMGIFYYVTAYAEYYQKYPQLCTPMFSFDLYRFDEPVHEMVQKITNARYNLLHKLITEAVEARKTSADCQALTDGLFGTLWSTVFLWKMSQCKFNLKERLEKSAAGLLHDAV